MKFNCILCKYNKYNKNNDNCFDHRPKDENGYPIGECPSLSNIYYGKLVKWFPFNIVQKIVDEIEWKRTEKFYEDFNEEGTENSNMKFIFGVKSYDDLTSNEPNLMTMNDLDLIYLKDKNRYVLSVETIYNFKNKDDEKSYLQTLLDFFTDYMVKNGYYEKEDSSLNPYGDMYEIFTGGININTEFETIEDAYRTFKFLVNGYLTL